MDSEPVTHVDETTFNGIDGNKKTMEVKRLQCVLTLVLLSLFSTHTHGVGSGGICAGCPMTQKVVDAEHLVNDK